MANFKGIGNELAKRFIQAKNKKYALNKIVHDMNYLVYADTKKPLDHKAKTAIMKHLFDVIAGRKILLNHEGRQIVPDFADVLIFFERRDYIIKQLRISVSHREQHN